MTELYLPDIFKDTQLPDEEKSEDWRKEFELDFLHSLVESLPRNNLIRAGLKRKWVEDKVKQLGWKIVDNDPQP